MLNPKDTIHSSIHIQQHNFHQAKSPHKIGSNQFTSFMNTCSNFAWNISQGKNNLSSARKQNQPQQKPSYKKILVLDDSLFENEHRNKMTDKIPIVEIHQNNKKNVPKNPFEQILNESDTPDFNLSLPFVDGFSQIDLKSPTFSDIFTMSEIKSPQFKNDFNQFFMTARKKNHEPKEDFNKTVKVGDLIKRDETKENFIQKMDMLIYENQVSKKQKFSSTIKSNNLKTNVSDYKKLSAGFKLKNHFNPSTPKINKIPLINQTQNINLPQGEKKQTYFSVESNPENQGQFFHPIAINVAKTPKIYNFSEKNKQIEKFVSVIKKENKENFQSLKDEENNFRGYKMVVPKKDLMEEMQEIYKGKFKLKKTKRY